MLALYAAGWVIVLDAVVVQPLLSVTVTIYVPAAKVVAVAVVCAGDEFHEYEYGAVPPVTLAVTAPVLTL